jgi:ABC-type nitrate/sulfonate/bicarbonate transport system substrate-binding protein
LQLKWRHQFQFAGYYAALEKGYYREAGLDVTIMPASPSTDPVDVVLKGGADFGIASSELVLRYAKGDPVVVLATIFQHSPLTLFVRSDTGIQSVRDLAGRRVALSAVGNGNLRLPAARAGAGRAAPARPARLQREQPGRGARRSARGYETDESYYLQQAGKQYRQFTPRSSGVDFYGDTLFSTRAMVTSQSDWVDAFRAASLRGWEYAMSHQEEIAELVHAKYAPDLPVDKLRFEAERMVPLGPHRSRGARPYARRPLAAHLRRVPRARSSCPKAMRPTYAGSSISLRRRAIGVGCGGCSRLPLSAWRWSSGSRAASIG